MDDDIFLMLKKDTHKVLFLLFTLRQYYIKKCHQTQVNMVDKSIIKGNISLLLIDKELKN
jgi:hypothetical protein